MQAVALEVGSQGERERERERGREGERGRDGDRDRVAQGGRRGSRQGVRRGTGWGERGSELARRAGDAGVTRRRGRRRDGGKRFILGSILDSPYY